MTVTGVSHISLSVSDLEAARKFWVDVFGLVVKLDQPGLVVLVHPRNGLVLACVTHTDGTPEPFDERQVGLDHLGLDVDSLETLREWEKVFADANVEHSSIVESPMGWHLNVRAPDNIAVELLVMSPGVRALLEG